jgi:hypothetical protein
MFKTEVKVLIIFIFLCTPTILKKCNNVTPLQEDITIQNLHSFQETPFKKMKLYSVYEIDFTGWLYCTWEGLMVLVHSWYFAMLRGSHYDRVSTTEVSVL